MSPPRTRIPGSGRLSNQSKAACPGSLKMRFHPRLISEPGCSKGSEEMIYQKQLVSVTELDKCQLPLLLEVQVKRC